MSLTPSEEGLKPHLATSTSSEKPRYSASDGPALDHRYFPHIIDLIWSYLDYPAIVPCAKTGSLWREKAMDYVDHVALFEFQDGSLVLRSRSLDWPEVSAALSHPQNYIAIFPFVLGGFEVVDIFFDTHEEFKDAPPSEWPLNFLRHSDYDDWPILQPSPTEIRNATVFLEYRNGHFFLGTVLAVVPCNINSLTLTVHCYTDPTQPSPSITAAHVNTVVDFFTGVESVERFNIILFDSRNDDPSCQPQDVGCSCCDTDSEERVALTNDSRVPDLGSCCELLLLGILMPKLRSINVVGEEVFVDDTYASWLSYRGPLADVLDEEAAANNSQPYSSKISNLTHKQYEAWIEERQYRLRTER